MTTLYHGKLTSGVSLETWLNDAKTYAGDASYEHLGTSSTIRTAILTRHVNRIVEDTLRLNPLLANKKATLSLSSGETRKYDLPSDLHGVDIYLLQFEPTDLLGRAIPVHYVRRDMVRPNIDDGTLEVLADRFEATLTDDGTDIEVWPEPPSDYSLICFYRIVHAAITTSNVDTPSGVTVGEIPADAADYVALRLAEVIARAGNQRERAKDLKADAAEELLRLQRVVTGAVGSLGKQETYDDRDILAPYGDNYYESA